MTTIARCLIEAAYAANAETTQYTAPEGSRVSIDKFTATNVTGAPATITVKLVPSGGAAGASNIIVQTKALAAGECYTFPELVGHVLNTGDFISTLATVVTALVIRASGRQIS